MDKAVYIRNATGWRNANDDLNIRGNYNSHNTIAGSPTVETVPRVYAFTGSIWDQIYPAKEKKYGKITINKPLNYYRWVPGLTASSPMWGWKNGGRASQGFYGIDYDDDHINDDMTNTQRRNMGWLGLGTASRSELPNADTVKQITYLRFDMTRGDGAGHYREYCDLSIGLNKIPTTNVPNDRSNNPHENGNVVGEPIVLCKLNPCENTVSSDTTYTVDLSTTKGKTVADMIMKWMKGEGGANSIVCRNKEYSGIVYKGAGCWSDNYTSLKKFAMTIEYIAEA